MKLISSILLTSASAFALSNAITFQNLSGSTQTNIAKSAFRHFANREICEYPAAWVQGTLVTYWQADVRTRWPADANCAGGYVKTALMTIEVTIASGGTAVVEFRNSATPSSGGAGLSKADMLAFDGGNGAGVWPSRGTFTTGGVTFNTSLKTMLNDNHYQVLANGPLRTTIKILEGPDAVSAAVTRTSSFGWRCTSTPCVSPYDSETWTDDAGYYSIRPSGYVSFYRSPTAGTGRVESDFLYDNGWMDKAQDQRLESAVLYRDDTGTTAGYTAPAAFVIPWRSRMFEKVWSIDPPNIHTDLNFNYLYYSKVIPAYGPEFTISDAAETLELTNATDGFDIFDKGQTTTASVAPRMGMGGFVIGQQGAGGGGGPTIAPLFRWDARWARKQSPGLLAAVLGNSKASMHVPVFYLENNTTATNYRSGGSEKAFGRFPSIITRPTFQSFVGTGNNLIDAPTAPSGCVPNAGGFMLPSGATACTTSTAHITCTSNSSGTLRWCNTVATNTVNKWGHDIAPRTANHFMAYIATGDYVYLDGLQAEGAWIAATGVPGQAAAFPNIYAERWTGVFYDLGNSPRSSAWSIWRLSWAALFSPDGTPEKSYFTKYLDDTLEMTRGRLGIAAAGRTCSGFNKNTETDPWKMGRCYYENNRTVSPLRQFTDISEGLWEIPCYCSVSPDAGAIYGNFQHQYVTAGFGHMHDLGVDVLSILQFISEFNLHLTADTALGGPLFSRQYYLGAFKGDVHDYSTSWSHVAASKKSTAILAKPVGPSDSTITVVGLLGSQINPEQNMMDAAIMAGIWTKVDDEIFYLQSYDPVDVNWDVASVDPTLNRVVTNVTNSLADGDAVTISGTLATGMDGNPTCTGATKCWYYVEVINGTTFEMYTDAARTLIVDFSGSTEVMTVGKDVVYSVDTATDRVVVPGNNYADGEATMFQSELGTLDNGMIGGANCSMNKLGVVNQNCWFYVKVIDAVTLELYTDAALTSLVNLTGGSSSVIVTRSTAGTRSTCGSGTGSCRGAYDTVAASHNPGSIVTRLPISSYFQRDPNQEGDAHGSYYSAGLAVAVDIDATTTDSLTSETISAQRAWEQYWKSMRFTKTFGGGVDCSGRNNANCDNNFWAILPRHKVKDVVAHVGGATAELTYTAPSGGDCKVNVSASPITSTDSASHTSDGQKTMTRSFDTGVSAAGTYNYMITCGYGDGTARTLGTFTIEAGGAVTPTGNVRGGTLLKR